MDTVIAVKNLNVWYNHSVHAVKNVSIDIPRHTVVALIGPSGCGKSTFLRSLNRLLDTMENTNIEGEVIFNGKNIYHGDVDVTALRKQIGMVFQNPTPFPKSIYDNIAYGPLVNNEVGGYWGLSGIIKKFKKRKSASEVEASKDKLDGIVRESLKEAALWGEVKDRLFKSAYGLSGGQQQRLCIARAIAVKPEVILLDEPTSDLDPMATKKIEELVLKLKDSYTVIIVTHNIQQASRISDYVAFFHLGELVEYDTKKNIFTNPRHQLTAAYVKGEFG
ncbi:phosphate ABC transporter ATP-binding protein [Candidatus Falkowbacteria bacterium RIFCSPLOWO2_02_FULL_45_15]|uniref:Phosphate ABC transporter ATP-binding protein n=1 Tax=Candidatus Falkowbacteria bacterium RIFCSPLOWO2_02_FULL_45_15 TaxID=1797988 RepID=A0A1F5RVR1_9BACT|nr:MAG: phosphate ABC transporter ATP-binding protein [Candidatus Falkowbacteria bacterium RIFCSPLOWO2_02_FULL_45_15]